MAKKTDPLAIDFTQRTPQRVDPFIDLVPQGSNMPRPADITGAIPMGELNIPDVRGDARFFGGYKDSPTPQQNPNFGAGVEGYMAPPAQAPDIFAPQAPAHSPQQAPQAQPQSVAGAVDARMTAPTQPESQYPRIAEGTEFSDLRIKGYTDEENRRFNQEANIGNAKKGIGERIAAKELAKSLESQGLSRDEINKAIGGDTAETLGNLKAMQAGRSPSAKGRMVNSRARDNAVQGAVSNEDGTPKNREARVVGYMDWADGTGNDPQGKSRKDMMSPGQWNQFDRDTKTLSRGKNEPLEKKLVNTMKQVDAKIERAYNKKIAERTTKELGIAQAKLGLAISAEQRQADRNQIDSWKTELEQLDEIDVPLLGGGDKKKEIAARKQQIFENITEFNKSKEGGQSSERDSVIGTLMKSNPSMSKEDAEEYALSQGYIK